MRGTKGKWQFKVLVAMAAMVTVFTWTGCGGSSDYAMSENTAAEAPMEEYVGGFDNGSSVEVTEASSTSTTAIDRKLIKTVDMTVETQAFDQMLATIEQQVQELGGYIESMNTYYGSKYSSYTPVRDASMTIRIPKDNLASFLSTVSEVGNVTHRNDEIEDVTLTYVDMESHKEALQTEHDRLLELLENAQSLEDIIVIESRLSEVRYEIESMESQLRTFDNQVDYSTVYLYINEVEVFTPVEEESIMERIASGFVENLQDIGNGIVELFIWFVINIPYFALLAIIVIVVVVVVRICVKKSEKKNEEARRAAQAAQAAYAAQFAQNAQMIQNNNNESNN